MVGEPPPHAAQSPQKTHPCKRASFVTIISTPPFRPEASNVVTGSGVVYKNRVDAPIAQFTSDPTPHPSLLLTTQKSKREILSSLVLYRESSLSKTPRSLNLGSFATIIAEPSSHSQICNSVPNRK